jgi:hypothetical protein
VWDENQYLRIIEAIKKIPHPVDIRVGVGGEFFTSKTLIQGARLLANSKNCIGVNLITNLSFIFEQYMAFFEGFDMAKVGLVASYHETQVKNKERWLATAQRISREVDFGVVAVAWPPLLGKLPEIKSMFMERGIFIFFQAFQGYYNGKKYPEAYTPEEREILRSVFHSRYDYEYMVELKKPGLCNAGLGYVFLNMNGDMYRCGGILLPLGNIISMRYKLFNTPKPCPVVNCYCDTDNLNTVEFNTLYKTLGVNQHNYIHRYGDVKQEYQS